MNKDLRQNFIYPQNIEKTYRFGSNQLTGEPLREDGDWTSYLPPEELQKQFGVESSACYVEAQQKAIATILEETFNLTDSNFSARFNALLSGGTPMGGDPIAGAESIRTDGLVPEEELPFLDYVTSWLVYHSFEGGDEAKCRQAGKKFLEEWELGYDIVFERGDSLEVKLAKAKKAITYSPLPMSLYADADSEGNYQEKPEYASDTHLALAVKIEGDVIWIWDTYSPFLKKLPAKYNSDFCMRWTVKKRDKAKKKSFWSMIVERFLRQIAIYKEFLNKK